MTEDFLTSFKSAPDLPILSLPLQTLFQEKVGTVLYLASHSRPDLIMMMMRMMMMMMMVMMMIMMMMIMMMMMRMMIMMMIITINIIKLIFLILL